MPKPRLEMLAKKMAYFLKIFINPVLNKKFIPAKYSKSTLRSSLDPMSLLSANFLSIYDNYQNTIITNQLLMNLKVVFLLFCLIQIAFFQNNNDNRGRGRGNDDKGGDDNGGRGRGGDDRGGNNDNRRQCKIEYYPGNHEVRLWSGQRTLARNNFLLNDLEFDGYCNCNMYLYSQTNFRGLVLNYLFRRSNNHHIYPNRVWNKRTRSFRVVCNF